jgi:hypothetical protein
MTHILWARRRGSHMKRALLMGVGVLITAAGVIFTLQGLGASAEVPCPA